MGNSHAVLSHYGTTRHTLFSEVVTMVLTDYLGVYKAIVVSGRNIVVKL